MPTPFMQAEQALSDDLTPSGIAHRDDHSSYGRQFSPRVSLLFRPDKWTLPDSIGRGFVAAHRNRKIR